MLQKLNWKSIFYCLCMGQKEAMTWLHILYKATQSETWDSSDIEVIFQGNI